jgi:hypothetical protein
MPLFQWRWPRQQIPSGQLGFRLDVTIDRCALFGRSHQLLRCGLRSEQMQHGRGGGRICCEGLHRPAPSSIQYRNGSLNLELWITECLGERVDGLFGVGSGQFLHVDHSSRSATWIARPATLEWPADDTH